MNLDARAKEILKENDLGGYTVPTRGLYPYQWNWDSVFAALGFSTFCQDRAWVEIETLFAAQWPNGFVPHIVFYKEDPDYFPGPEIWRTNTQPPSSGISQPPVAASIVRELWERGDQAANRPRLRTLFPKLLAWHRWFHRYRDPLHKGLVLTVHPWETGRDNSAEWDAPAAAVDTSNVGPYQRRDTHHVDSDMRPLDRDYDRYMAMLQFGRKHQWNPAIIAAEGPFRVLDVGMTMVLLRADRDLQALARVLGETTTAGELQARIDRAEAGIDYLWDHRVKSFCSRDTITGLSSGYVTSMSFLAFYAGVGSPQQRAHLCDHLERIEKRVRFMLPSLDPELEVFDSIRYWRGPVWSVVNYMAARGFAENGLQAWADRLYADTQELVATSGFYESFCPITGRGSGGNNFSWTAAIWLFLDKYGQR